MSFFDAVGIIGFAIIGLVAIYGMIRLLAMGFMIGEARRYSQVPENRRHYFLEVQDWHVQRGIILYLIIALLAAVVFSLRPPISLDSTIQGGNVSGRLAEIMMTFQSWAREGDFLRWLIVGSYWPITVVLYLIPELVFGVLGTLISVVCTGGVLLAFLMPLFAPAASVVNAVIVVFIFRKPSG